MQSKRNFESSFNACFRRYRAPLTGFLDRMVGDRDTAEDMVQDTFIKILEKNCDIDPGATRTGNFIFTVGKTTTLDHMRKERREGARYQEYRKLREIELNEEFFESLENACIHDEMFAVLNDALEEVPEEERRLYLKRAVAGEAYTDIAKAEGCSKYRFINMEKRINGKLKEALLPYGKSLRELEI
jgi:RNA polymerase sigma-70 factor (ECF subfamily)